MRGAVARLLVLVVALTAMSPAPAAAVPMERVPIHVEYKLEVKGPTRVCKNVPVEYVVRVVRYGVAQVGSDTTRLDWGDTATTLRLVDDGRASSFQTRGFNGRVEPGTPYRRTFRATGTYTLTFSADFNQIQAGGGVHALSPVSIDVEVVDCTYNVTTMSVWIMPTGFRPWMGAIMQRVRMVPTTPEGPEYRAEGSLTDVAIPQFQVCSVTMTVSSVDVTLRGLGQLVGNRRSVFQLELSYGRGSVGGGAGTVVQCPYVQGGNSDTFSLDPLLHTFPPEGGVASKSHVLHAGGMGDIVGTTVIVVTQGSEP